ncbi:MAG: hypothetical protein KYX66_06800 [Blastomonas fulva]|nr:hypothetical protein [Blastomonas fulva]MDK2756427.1 hypothetical protein [Blastomonas fulva]
MTATRWTLDRIMQTPKKDIMAAIKRGDGPAPRLLAQLVAESLAREQTPR